MALIHADGFDHYAAPSETAANIVSYLQAAGYTVNNANNQTFQIQPGQDVNSNCIKMTINAGSGTPPSFSRAFNTTADKIIFGFSFRGTGSRQRVARINGAVDLNWDPATGKLYIGTDIGEDVIILNAWWFIEIEIDKTASLIRVYANDTLQLTSPLTGGAITNNHVLLFGLTGASASAATIEIDDFYVVDSGGGQNINRLGPVQAITRAPTTDVTAEWTQVGATGTHAAIAAQLSPNAANAPYLQANIEGKRDRFSSNTVLPNDNQIFGVVLVAFSRKGDLDDRQLGMTMRTAGGEVEALVPLSTSFAYRTAVYEQAPGNVPWNQNRVESSEFGIVAR